MKFDEPIPIKKLADEYKCQIVGNKDILASGINVIHSVEKGDITFVDVEKYYNKSIQSPASIIIIDKNVDNVPEGKALLINETPFHVYDQIIQTFRPTVYSSKLISCAAEIHPTAIIEPNVVIGPHVTIGANTVIQSNSYIGSYSNIGADVIIEPNCIIGSDAFYYKKENGTYIKWTSGGDTILEDQVHVGAGSTINKGVSSSTVIGFGTKIDCQVHIGHGCKVGKNCLIAGQVGIGGKTKVGDEAVLYGQVGIAQNITIGNRVVILAKSGVSKNIPDDKVYFGYPAGEVFVKNRELASLRKLPEFMKKVDV